MLPSNLLLGLKSAPKDNVKKEKKSTRETEDGQSRQYFRHEKWWMKHNVTEGEQCTQELCTFEPGTHPVHNKPKYLMSFVEKKILVKFLINNNAIKDAKGKKVYELMISKGYLKHRTWETLRNCFRRTILQEIDNYKLQPLHLAQFKRLDK